MYRGKARKALDRAKIEMVSGEDERLKYAALELRMALECLTYDRALAYKDEFPETEYENWQPRKVFAQLLEIDPLADQSRSLAFGIEPSLGERPEVMHSLGTERVVGVGLLKKHYEPLGSYLHIPTLKQARSTVPVDYVRLRARCDELVTLIEEVLSAHFFNSTLGTFCDTPCARCSERVRRRIPSKQEGSLEAKCFGCRASYTLELTPTGCIWMPQQETVRCGLNGCDGYNVIWTSDAKEGAWWRCEICAGINAVRLGIVYTPPTD